MRKEIATKKLTPLVKRQGSRYQSRDGTGIRLEVSDTGKGFHLPTGDAFISNDRGGFGLLTIRERVESLGGNFHIASALGRGTRATVWLPKAGRVA